MWKTPVVLMFALRILLSDTCVWTGGSPFEFNSSFLLNPTFVNEGFTHSFFISLVLDEVTSTWQK